MYVETATGCGMFLFSCFFDSLNKKERTRNYQGCNCFSLLTDIMSNICTFCVYSVFPLDILFMLLQHPLCLYPVLYVSLALITLTKDWQNTVSMPWCAFKMLVKFSDNICVPCTKMHSKVHIAFKKLFHFKNNNCI